MHFIHFSNAHHTFLIHLTSLLYLYKVFLHYITHTYTQDAHIHTIVFIQGFVIHCIICSSSNVAFSSWIALHFSVKDVSVVFISCLVSVVLDVHCIFFPWTWSFFLSILELLLVALLLWLFYCLIGHLKGNENETRFWACLKKTACIHTILRFWLGKVGRR